MSLKNFLITKIKMTHNEFEQVCTGHRSVGPGNVRETEGLS